MAAEGVVVDEDVGREDVDPFELADRRRLSAGQGNEGETIVGEIEAAVAERIGLEGAAADEAHGGGDDEVLYAAETIECVVGDDLETFGEDELLEVVEAIRSREGEFGVIAAADDLAAGLHGVAAREALLEADETGAIGGVAHAKGVDDSILNILGGNLVIDGDGASLGDFDRPEAAVFLLCENVFHFFYFFGE